MLLVASGTPSLQPRFSFYRPITTTKNLRLESASAFVSREVQCTVIIAHVHAHSHTHKQLYHIIIYISPKIMFSYGNRFLRGTAIDLIRRR